MSTFFEKARERAQAAAAQLGGGQGQASPGAEDTAGGKKSSFTYTGSLPHMLRHGMASVDPRHEYNRSFHQLSGKVKSVAIDHEALARETRGVATATYRWGHDHLAESREDGVCDEALADVADRLAYMLSLVGDLHAEHAQRVETSRADLKRIQKVEAGLAPKRQARNKVHHELMTLLPERAKQQSDKIDALEAQMAQLESADKGLEDQLSKLKREALRSSYDSHFDSMIELGEKMALVARHGKLLLSQLPVYSPPFPAPRVPHRTEGEPKWQGEAEVAAIRAAVGPALRSYKPNLSLAPMPDVSKSSALSSTDTEGYAESHKDEIASVAAEETSSSSLGHVPSAAGASVGNRPRESSLSHLSPPLDDGNQGSGGLPARINMDPAVIPNQSRRLSSTTSPPTLPPRPTTEGHLSEDPFASESALDNDDGPTLAETGSPIASGGDPGPLTGTLAARPKGPPAEKMPMPAPPPGVMAPPSLASATPISLPSAASAPPARLRRDGTIVRRGDHDWAQAELEQLPPYHE